MKSLKNTEENSWEFQIKNWKGILEELRRDLLENSEVNFWEFRRDFLKNLEVNSWIISEGIPRGFHRDFLNNSKENSWEFQRKILDNSKAIFWRIPMKNFLDNSWRIVIGILGEFRIQFYDKFLCQFLGSSEVVLSKVLESSQESSKEFLSEF